MTPDSKTETPQRVGPVAPLFGVLQRAGTFPVRDEETTGFVVSCKPDDLARIERLPMYRPVVIIEINAWLEQATKRGLAIGALTALSWQVDAAMREKIEGVLAELDTPNA